MQLKVSQKARSDLLEIGRYTRQKWGKDQSRKYLIEIDEKFSMLAQNPYMGRPCDNIREAYFRVEYISHVIFYRLESDSILISRIIHKSRDIKAQLLD